MVYSGSATRGPRARVEAYVRAVAVELELRADECDARFGPPGSTAGSGAAARPPLGSIYLGGGTPSLLPAADVAALLERIERRYGLAPGAEVTIEANPAPDERGDLAGFRAAGVTRISLGAQSLDTGELRRLGRRHSPADVLDAVDAARRAGIEHRSVDLLYDLPDQSMATWQATVAGVLEAPIDHVSAYALTLDDPEAAGLVGAAGDHLPVRPGARRWRQAAATRQDDDRAADQYLWLDGRLTVAGFSWYEVSNWARPGGASHHNQAYWRRLPTIGVGPGAHGFDGDRRRSWNAARLDGYLAALIPADVTRTAEDTRPRRPPGGVEELDDDAIRLERIALALRTADGVAPLELPGGAGSSVAQALKAGLLERLSDGRLRLTPPGRLMAAEVTLGLSR